MRILYGLIGIPILLVVGWLFLSDYLSLREAGSAPALTIDAVKRLGTRNLPTYFVLKDVVRKNLASVQSSARVKRDGKHVSPDIIYPVYSKAEAMDTAFDATMKNEAVVFIAEPMKVDTMGIHVVELFQPITYRVKNIGAELTQEERRLFDEQDIRVSYRAIKLMRDHTIPKDEYLYYALFCWGGAIVLTAIVCIWIRRRHTRPRDP